MLMEQVQNAWVWVWKTTEKQPTREQWACITIRDGNVRIFLDPIPSLLFGCHIHTISIRSHSTFPSMVTLKMRMITKQTNKKLHFLSGFMTISTEMTLCWPGQLLPLAGDWAAACRVLRAISRAPSWVLFPPMKPPAWTKIHPLIPLSSDSASSRTPRHSSSRDSLGQGGRSGDDKWTHRGTQLGQVGTLADTWCPSAYPDICPYTTGDLLLPPHTVLLQSALVNRAVPGATLISNSAENHRSSAELEGGAALSESIGYLVKGGQIGSARGNELSRTEYLKMDLDGTWRQRIHKNVEQLHLPPSVCSILTYQTCLRPSLQIISRLEPVLFVLLHVGVIIASIYQYKSLPWTIFSTFFHYWGIWQPFCPDSSLPLICQSTSKGTFNTS